METCVQAEKNVGPAREANLTSKLTAGNIKKKEKGEKRKTGRKRKETEGEHFGKERKPS